MRNLLFIFFISSFCFSQVVITKDTKEVIPDNSAILDLRSDLGFLLPVMTEEQRNLIPVNEDSKGLIVYSLTSKSLNIYDGENWHIIYNQNKGVGTSAVCPKERNFKELLNCIQSNYKVKNSLGYDKARDVIYGEIDLDNENKLEGIYTGYKIVMDYTYSKDPSTEAYRKGVNAEHLFPQSMGALKEPARSDMYHIYPAKDNVNSSRNNCPHYEIIDSDVEKWFINDIELVSKPTENVEGYSKKINKISFPKLSDKQQCAFEPRDQVKGKVARAVFYFYTMYNKLNTNEYEDYADDEFFKVMQKYLVEWDKKHPIEPDEIERAKKIQKYQGNENPFILDPQLGQRLYSE